MASSADWYQDDVALLGTLREGRGVRTPTIAGYSELKELRRGGQGVVYIARQVSTKRRVAIKVLLETSLAGETTRRRFEREIDLIASLSHPNIVKVYDSGVTADGRHYFVMEFIDGAGLDELIASTASPTRLLAADGDAPRVSVDVRDVHPLVVQSSALHAGVRQGSAVPRPALDAAKIAPQGSFEGKAEPCTTHSGGTPFQTIDAALRVFTKICDAVNFAHQRGVIHRDLKPSNVRIDPHGEPHVLDFGLAKLADGSGDADLTQMSETGHFMGSLPWASPEQTEGSPSRIDIRTDVYSLGVVLFQLLTGRYPYPVTGSLRVVLENIQRAEPQRPSAWRRDIDEELETIILKCLAKAPERRYQSAGELARDLRSYQAGEPIAAKRDSAWYGLKKNLERYRVAARVMCAAVIVVFAFAVAMSYLWKRAASAEHLASQRLTETEAARQAETAARRDAEISAERAKKTVAFLEKTLLATDQWKTPGRDIGPLRDVLDGASRRADTELAGYPEVEAAVRGMLGWDYWEIGLYDAAEPHLQKTYDICQQLYGADHAETHKALNNLAMFVGERGRHKESEELYERLLTSARAAHGEDAVLTLRAGNNLAAELVEQGRFAEAAAIVRRVLDGERRVLGEHDESTTASMTTLVNALSGLAQYGEAEALAREIIEMRARKYGETAPETLKAVSNLGYVLEACGKFDEAEALLRDTREKLSLLISPGHPTAITNSANLASLLGTRQRWEEAEALLREVLEQQRAFSGEQSVDVVRRMNNLGHALLSQKKYEEAESLLREALKRSITLEGERSEGSMFPRNNLAVLLDQTGRKAEGEQLYRFVLDARRLRVGRESESTLISELNLGLFLVDDGRAAEAEPLLAQTVATAKLVWPQGHWNATAIEAGYGRCLSALGRTDEAERLLAECYRAFAKSLGPSHDRTHGVAKALAEIYEKRGDTLRAQEFRGKAND